MSTICRHGGLGRKCDICRLEAEVESLKADVEWFKKLADDRLRRFWADINVRAAEVAALRKALHHVTVYADNVTDSYGALDDCRVRAEQALKEAGE